MTTLVTSNPDLHKLAQHGLAWHDIAWHGMAWHGLAWSCIYFVCLQSHTAHAGYSGAQCNWILSALQTGVEVLQKKNVEFVGKTSHQPFYIVSHAPPHCPSLRRLATPAVARGGLGMLGHHLGLGLGLVLVPVLVLSSLTLQG